MFLLHQLKVSGSNNAASIVPVAGSGSFVKKAGDTMTGDGAGGNGMIVVIEHYVG